MLAKLFNFMAFLLVFSLLSASQASAASPELAIEGYDVVAYFTDAVPTEGSAAFQTEYGNQIWRFKNREHLDLFLAKPESYIPQYGGYCAFAAAHNAIASGDPHRWRIVNNKLYLNNNFVVHNLWQGDIPGNISDGDKNWPALQQRLEKKAHP